MHFLVPFAMKTEPRDEKVTQDIHKGDSMYKIEVEWHI